jgi:hypothetical protein
MMALQVTAIWVGPRKAEFVQNIAINSLTLQKINSCPIKGKRKILKADRTEYGLVYLHF